MMLEAGQMRIKKEEYFKTEVEKVTRVLKAWTKNPKRSKKELGVVPWEESDSDEGPLTDRELNSMKNFIKKYCVVSHDDVSPRVQNAKKVP